MQNAGRKSKQGAFDDSLSFVNAGPASLNFFSIQLLASLKHLPILAQVGSKNYTFASVGEPFTDSILAGNLAILSFLMKDPAGKGWEDK